MKTFIVSIVTFFIILSSVILYIFLLHSSTEQLSLLSEEIIKAAQDENWALCEEKYDLLSKKWNKDRKWYEAFTNHRDTEHITDLILEMKFQAQFKNKKEIIIKGTKLKETLFRIYDDEIPTFENVV